MRTKKVSMWHLAVLSARGRLRRRRAIRRGSQDWIACTGRPFSMRECRAFTGDLRRAAEPVRRLHEEKALAQRGADQR